MAAVNTPSRVSYGSLAAGIGGIILVISLFLPWFSSGGFSQSGWESASFIDIVLFVIGVLAVAYAVFEVTGRAGSVRYVSARPLQVLGIVATSLAWATIFEGSDQAIGLWLAGLSALAILAGGILAERSPESSLALGGGGARPAAGPGPAGGPGGGGFAPPPQAPQQQPQATPPTAAQGGFGAPPQAPPGEQATTARQVPSAAQPGSPPPPPGGAADWYPDPLGEKRLRYWDGTQWTQHSAD